jgi:hypothetical protein
MFDRIEKLKTEWTDKYVVINSSAPELSRFASTTGTVKTVNMNGRCLVEFDQFNNTGWYDIDPSALKIVPKPLPKPVVEKAKPAATSKPAAAAKPVAAKPAAGKPGAAKPSTADILAAARGKAGSAAAATPAASPAPAPTAAAKPKLSTADVLAAARGAKVAAASPAKEAEPASEPEADEPPAAVAPAAKAAKPAAGPLPTTTAEKIAWCRAHDAKG